MIKTQTEVKGPYLTSAQVDNVVRELIVKCNLPKHIGAYIDGKRHIGTECSRIYKNLFPLTVSQDELCYLKATAGVCSSFNKEGILYNLKALDMKSGGDTKYIQLISLNIVAIYLGGKLKLSDQVIDSVLQDCVKNRVTLSTSNSNLVAGNKPVNIEGKPLVKILKQNIVDQELRENKAPQLDLGIGLGIIADQECAMTYVKTGPLMRKDIYIVLKAIAAKENKPMYLVIEEMLLGDSPYDLSCLPGGGR